MARKQGLDHLSSSLASKSTRGTRNPSHNLPLPLHPPSRLHRTILPLTHLLPVTAPSPRMNPCSPILREPTPAFDLSPVLSNFHFVPMAFRWCAWTYSNGTELVPGKSGLTQTRPCVIVFLLCYSSGPFSLYSLAIPFVRRCRFVSNTLVLDFSLSR